MKILDVDKKHLLANTLFGISAIFIVYLYAFYPSAKYDRAIFSIGSVSLITHYFWMFIVALKREQKNVRWFLLFVFLFFIASFSYHIFIYRKKSEIRQPETDP